MRLLRLCWDPRGVYVALTDAGAFVVPNVAGGWHSREPLMSSYICKPPPNPTALQFLGMVQAPAVRMGACNCQGQRARPRWR